MKKFICLLVAVAAVLSCSCNNDASFGIEYALNSDGNTDGMVTLVFPAGEFSLKGDAGYQFHWTNVDKVVAENEVLPLDKSLGVKDAKVSDAAKRVNEWLESAIHVTEAEGNYDIYVNGYVKETLTGITFAIDRHFTNKEE